MMLITYNKLFPEVAASLLTKYGVPQAGPICNQYSLPVDGALGGGMGGKIQSSVVCDSQPWGSKTLWIPMDSYGFPMNFNRFLWISMNSYGFLWILMDSNGFPQISMHFNEFLKISMDFNEFQQISTDFNEFLWIPMDSNAFP